MNPEKLLSAIGEIDDRFIADAHIQRRALPMARRLVALAAALILVLSLGVSALAAADVEPAYDFLYRLSPALAQRLKPVQLTCMDNGIEMKVISANVEGNEANILVSLRDLEGNRVDASTDLFDSYEIHTPSPSFEGTCSMLDYDEESGTATFLVYLAQPDGTNIEGNKITFSVSCFISGKQSFEGPLDLDLGAAEWSPNTQTDVAMRGADDFANDSFLVPGELATPAENVRITAMGFIDDKLHIQAHFADIFTTDAHGLIYLSDDSNEPLDPFAEFSFWDAEGKGSYEEYIFDVSPTDIEKYRLYGWFESSENFCTGDWQVTFAL